MIKSAAIPVMFFVMLLSVFTADAQRFKNKYKYNAIGGSIGFTNYFGDLNPAENFYNFNFRTTGIALAAHYIKKLGTRISARGQFQVGTIYGNDSKTKREGDALFRHRRNLSFKNTIYELKADLIVDLWENRRDLRKRSDWNYYVFAGIAGFYHNPKAKLNGKWHALQPLGTEGQNIDGVGVDGRYSKFGVAIPFGVGVKYKYKTFWDIGFEIGMRYAFTDYLDDVSSNYVDRTRFSKDDPAYWLADRALESATSEEEIIYENGEYYVNGYGREGEKRGDINTDWYWSYNFTLTYIIQPRFESPKFR